jgi:hypothetical protein
MGISFSDKVYGNLGVIIDNTETTGVRRSISVMTKVPRFKFNFLLQIQLQDQPSRIDFERVRTVTLPEVTFDTKIMNQYNIKRVVQSKMNYGACTVVFYDTYDSDFLRKIAIPYTRNYYNNGEGLSRISDASAKQISPLGDTFTGNFGLTTTSPSNRYFIPEIRIKKVGPVDSDFYHVMKNCMITSIAGDTMDYSDSQPVQFTVTFQPERIELTSNPDLTTG